MHLRVTLAVFAVSLSATLSAQPSPPAPLAFLDLNSGKSFKPGTQQTISWTGGAPSEHLRLEVYQEGNPLPVQIIDSGFENANQLTFKLDKNLKAGHKYYFLLTRESGEDAVKSASFSMKKIPLWVKIAVPVVVVGGIILLLNNMSSSGSGDDGGIVDPPRPN